LIQVKYKEYQVKEQCLNCAFPNGQFAVECEMCGRSLTKTVGKGRMKYERNDEEKQSEQAQNSHSNWRY
jgi:ribosomal protein S27E